MCKYVNSICICDKSLFISPILDSNWWSDLIASDRQHSLMVRPWCGRTATRPKSPHFWQATSYRLPMVGLGGDGGNINV